jgi:lantibiotic biosynthesis protein
VLPTESRGWEPLLEGPEAEQARNIVSELAVAVRELPSVSPTRCLRGATGRALFLSYAASAGLADEADAIDLLESDLVTLFSEGCAVGLWYGYAGLRWALTHLVVDGDAAETLGRIDALLSEVLAEDPWKGPYDLAEGLAGLALAYSAASVATASIQARILDHLDEVHETGTDRRALGCAHGLAGVVGAVARLAVGGVQRERCGRILERAMPSLLALAAADSEPNAGWCRGDAGLAVVSLAAARATDRADWGHAATELGHRAIATARGREPPDACLCHGMAGLAHLFNRLYQSTRQDAFREAALHFLRRTVDLRRPGEGAAGYTMFWRTPDETRWVATTTLFAGVAGVGLALLAAITPIAPAWDSLLLADVS